MIITIDMLRKAGCTDAQILQIVELVDNERTAARREQNRINKRNQRSRQQMVADVDDIANRKEKTKQNQRSRHHVSADSDDIDDTLSPPVSPSLKEKIPHTPLRENNPSPLNPPSPGGANAPKRATRLADDWQPINGDAEFGAKILPKDWRIEGDKFRDYWHAKPGQHGTKLDWSATWRNWCRKAAETKGYPSQPDMFGGATSFYPKGYIPE